MKKATPLLLAAMLGGCAATKQEVKRYDLERFEDTNNDGQPSQVDLVYPFAEELVTHFREEIENLSEADVSKLILTIGFDEGSTLPSTLILNDPALCRESVNGSTALSVEIDYHNVLWTSTARKCDSVTSNISEPVSIPENTGDAKLIKLKNKLKRLLYTLLGK